MRRKKSGWERGQWSGKARGTSGKGEQRIFQKVEKGDGKMEPEPATGEGRADPEAPQPAIRGLWRERARRARKDTGPWSLRGLP